MACSRANFAFYLVFFLNLGTILFSTANALRSLNNSGDVCLKSSDLANALDTKAVKLKLEYLQVEIGKL
jgi:hypothetical protein